MLWHGSLHEDDEIVVNGFIFLQCYEDKTTLNAMIM